MIKKIIVVILLIINFNAFSQCVPNSIYQDSIYGVWPISGFPDGMVDIYYHQSWDMKMPSTLLEAAFGDSSAVTVDTLGSIIYIGDWPVDSVVTIDVYDVPPGLVIDCSVPTCAYPGDQVGCADISGFPTKTGTYSTDIVTNLYTHGVVSITVGGVPLTIPVELDYFSVTGTYDTISRYSITITELTSINEVKDDIEITNIMKQDNDVYFEIYSHNSNEYTLNITNILGTQLYNEYIFVNSGKNEYSIDKNLTNGIYIFTIKNNTMSFSKKVAIHSL